MLPSDEGDPADLAALEKLGFRNPEQAIAAVRAWQSGRYRCNAEARARERLSEFLPSLLDIFGRTAEPDSALATFDKVMAEMPAGVQLFSLLAANPSLLRLVADIMGTAPRLASVLARRPRLLDALLDPGFFGAVPTPAKLKELVQRVAGTSHRLSRTRSTALASFGREHGFLIGVRVISGTVRRRRRATRSRTLAETLIRLASPRRGRTRRRHGRMPGGQAAVVAMGKLGGREMTATSDLDLIIVYDFAGERTAVRWEAPLWAPILHALHPAADQRALGADHYGALYNVDMRLAHRGDRAGRDHARSLRDYQGNEAWTWEHLALTRARVVSGAGPCGARREGDPRRLCRPRDRATRRGRRGRDARRDRGREG